MAGHEALNSEMVWDRILKAIAAYVATDPGNRLPEHGGISIYDAPLVGVAAADDALFREFLAPEIIGPQHRSPTEWLSGARSVIACFLPLSLPVRESNRQPGLPSEEWVSARVEGEAFRNVLQARLMAVIAELGGRGVAPPLTPEYQVANFKSNWSERHVAYAAGLGSFGLGRSFITARGCAGRLASVVTDLELAPTRRTSAPFGYCPELSGNTCGECIARCPVQAISAEGKDVAKCQSYLDFTRKKFAPRYGCGKCQTGISCEEAIPGRKSPVRPCSPEGGN